MYLKSIFDRLDQDGSGTLSVLEVKKGLYDIENGEALFDRMIQGDVDGDGMISFNELLQCAIDFNVFIFEDYLR